jgi:hypothetical protein
MPLDRALQKRLIDKRARAMAMVRLTRRRDLDVRDEPAYDGLDMFVSILSKDKGRRCRFGVVLRGRLEEVSDKQANTVLGPTTRSLLRIEPVPFPVVLFLFTMHGDQGWYTWVAEPVVSPDEGPGLRRLGHPSCRPLDDEALDEIVARVVRWYDAMEAESHSEVPEATTASRRITANGTPRTS